MEADFNHPSPEDEIGGEVSKAMRAALGLTVFVKMMRDKGQRLAEATVKQTNEKLKEAREQQLRDARHAKAIDPRSEAMAALLDRSRQEMSSVPRLSNGRALYRTPQEISERAAEWSQSPQTSPTAEQVRAMLALRRGEEARTPTQALTPEQIRALNLQRGITPER